MISIFVTEKVNMNCEQNTAVNCDGTIRASNAATDASLEATSTNLAALTNINNIMCTNTTVHTLYVNCDAHQLCSY